MQTRAIRRSDRFNYQLSGMRFLLLDISVITTLNARTAHGELVVIQSPIGGKLWFTLRRESHLKKSQAELDLAKTLGKPATIISGLNYYRKNLNH